MPRAYNALTLSLVLVGLLAVATPAAAQVDARMLRFPDVSDTHITFVYAGDVWVAPKDGGTAQRLSTPAGEERFPRFSPDGSRIAFQANYDGNVDIYAVPTLGGQVERLTHHPLPDRMLEWNPDGESILIASFMQTEKMRYRKFFNVPASGGLPELLPVPYGEFGAISPDGSTIAYMPISRDFRTWKRYRGGMAPDIWLFDLNDYSARNISNSEANDGHPMWHGSTLYFLSDRGDNQRANIWAYELDSGDTRQVTELADFDVRFPAIGPSDLVFEAGGRLYLLDLDDETTREVMVDVVTDRSSLKPHNENVADLIAAGDISPSGKRVVLEARGDIFTVPAEHGITRNLTRSSGTAERSPAWSPDGKWIAYFGDASREYELTLLAADGNGTPRQLTNLGEGFRYSPYWSPDSNKLAFIDQTMTIRIYDLDAEALTEVDRGKWMYHGQLNAFSPSWSSDSRWLAYSRGLMNRHTAIFLFDIDSGERHQVTSGYYNDTSPVFDPDGDYLYVTTNRSLSPTYSDYQNTFIYANTTNVAAITLRHDVPSPLAPRNDEEEVEDDEAGEGSGDSDSDDDSASGDRDGDGDDADENADDEDAEDVEIDLDGFENRLVVLPAEAGNYGTLAAVSGKVIYHRGPRTGSGDDDSPIAFWDLEDREEKTILDDADDFGVSADGEKLIVAANGGIGIVSIAPGQNLEPLDTSGLQVMLDPVAEWRQIFNDAFRRFRDYFYVRNMHGVDWEHVGEVYSALIDDVVTRWDLDFLIGELIGELNAGHTYNMGGGDTEQARQRTVGLLGVDYVLEGGAYRLARIIDGAPWDSEVRSPLRQPGVDVDEGDYLLAVNGTPIDTSMDPWAAFQGMGGETVELTINDTPSMDGARRVLVETLRSEVRLRNLAWIESNRKRVEGATDGRIGYVYVPDTGRNGQTELLRQFASQIDKEGLIIDERFNNGGQIPDRFIELLNRPLYSYWGVRDGEDWQWPPVSQIGPKVMLINGWSGSGGDAFPLFFKHADLGPLIGTRTWGGLIGYTGVPGLIDGGNLAVPTFGIYSTEGEWIVEGHGVDPDIEVLENPTELARGTDTQLEAGIAEALRLLRENPVTRPARPAAPNRARPQS